jgi:hypothetical protein
MFARKTSLLFGVALMAAALTPSAKADQWDKKTIITINEPVQVPSCCNPDHVVVLQPGTYVLALVDSLSDRHIVRVLEQDQKTVVTTILAIPNYRLKPTDKSTFQFWETPAGQPRAMRAWFYPGDNFGQEFAYPKEMSAQISTGNSNVQVPVETSAVTNTTFEVPPPPHVSERAPEPAPAPPEPVQSVAVAQQPAPPEKVIEPSDTISHATPTELPHTASQEPLMLLAGLISLVAFAVLTVKTRRMQ